MSPDHSGLRRKDQTINSEFKLLGLDEEGIRNLSEAQFKKFRTVKKQLEEYLLQRAPIIVCTCMNSKSKRIKDLEFNRVIIDEAAQAKELECLIAINDAS